MIKTIMSGGQTGADRAAFDEALERGIDIAGFVPLGRRAEDGRIPDYYTGLIETSTPDPAERTRLNVELADATLILSRGPLRAGSKYTLDAALSAGKPCRHVDLSVTSVKAGAGETANWLANIRCSRLNVAGPRASEDPKIYGLAREFLAEPLK